MCSVLISNRVDGSEEEGIYKFTSIRRKPPFSLYIPKVIVFRGKRKTQRATTTTTAVG